MNERPKTPGEMSDLHLVRAIKYTRARLDSLEREAARRDIPPDAAQESLSDKPRIHVVPWERPPRRKR